MRNMLMLTSYLNSYAQLKYYEEIAVIIFTLVFFAICMGILLAVLFKDWWGRRK